MKKLISSITTFSNKIKQDNINAYASSCAFFIFMSLIPIIILLCNILPFTPISEQDVLSFLNTNIPGRMGEFIGLAVSEFYQKSISTVSITAIAAFWAAGKGINSLTTGLNVIENYEDKRNSLLVRLISCLYTLVLLVSILLFLVVMVYGSVIVDIIGNYMPGFGAFLEKLFIFRSLFFVFFMTLVFVILYALLPYKKGKFIEQIPGAFFTALAWTVFSLLFSVYVNNTNAFSMYGSFATIIVLLFWLYTCMSIVLIGANINRYLRPVLLLFFSKRRNRKVVAHQSESLEE